MADDERDPTPSLPPIAPAFARLLERLDAVAVPAGVFTPPPVDDQVARAVLGASGAFATPHRRLLDRRNGGYFWDGALHIFGACSAPSWHSLSAWNSPTLWRDVYGSLVDGLVFFAEDAFGDQFAYTGQGGEVVCFEAEIGRRTPVAPHFIAWLESILDAPESVLPVDVIRQKEHVAPGEQLYAWPPLVTAESKSGVKVGRVDAVEAMRVRGQIADQVRGLPSGSRLEVEIADDE